MLPRVSEPHSTDPEQFAELLGNEARLRALLGVAFDVCWEVTREADGTDSRIRLLQDLSGHLGFRPGEFPRSFTARE